ncbi:MAG: phosphomannomutase/phosphoglucomutase [Armatimonadetes bacterium]|nr:phosphomannomutase/phosphoglucomutase [Armatimonadota bacterium]
MNLDPHIFHAYDIRGTVGDQLTPESVDLICRAFGSRFRRHYEKPLLVVGRDLRVTSQEFAAVAMEALRATGCDVIDIGECPTPVVYFAIGHWGCHGGLGVTASHNPPQYNGLKLRWTDRPFHGEKLQELYQEAVAGNFTTGAGAYERRDVWPDYFACTLPRLQLSRKMTVVLDVGNGCGTLTGPRLLSGIGCDLEVLYPEPNGKFPHRSPDPLVPTHVQALSERVVASGADLGIALDADGDRIAVVDHTGEFLMPDLYMAPICEDVLRAGPATLVSEVRCSRAIIEFVQQRGGSVEMAACGYPFILQRMAETHAAVGFETTGHCYFDDPHIKFDDASFGAARLVCSLSRSDRPLRDLVQPLRERWAPSAEVRFTWPDGTDPAQIAGYVEAAKRQYRDHYPINETDGARVEMPDGWALFRASQTRPQLVARWEGQGEANRDRIGDELLRVLREVTGRDPD